MEGGTGTVEPSMSAREDTGGMSLKFERRKPWLRSEEDGRSTLVYPSVWRTFQKIPFLLFPFHFKNFHWKTNVSTEG